MSLIKTATEYMVYVYVALEVYIAHCQQFVSVFLEVKQYYLMLSSGKTTFTICITI